VFGNLLAEAMWCLWFMPSRAPHGVVPLEPGVHGQCLKPGQAPSRALCGAVRLYTWCLLDGWPLLSSQEWWGRTWYGVMVLQPFCLLEGTGRIQMVGS
jgi:hypothetical protein